jgi:hypothetical protein
MSESVECLIADLLGIKPSEVVDWSVLSYDDPNLDSSLQRKRHFRLNVTIPDSVQISDTLTSDEIISFTQGKNSNTIVKLNLLNNNSKSVKILKAINQKGTLK